MNSIAVRCTCKAYAPAAEQALLDCLLHACQLGQQAMHGSLPVSVRRCICHRP